jgi:hypothetical protein
VNNNPIAQMIVKLDLAKNMMTVQLENLFANNENDEPAVEETNVVSVQNKKSKAKAKQDKKKDANKDNLVELKPNCILVDINLGTVQYYCCVKGMTCYDCLQA